MSREKQIEEMADALRTLDALQYNPNYTVNYQRAVGLHSLGYRMQSDGECGFDGSGWTCSECGEYALVSKGTQKISNYCPNCGAKMKGESK